MYIGDGGEGGGSEPVSMDDFSFGIEGLKMHGAASRRNEVYIEERDVIVSELSTVRLRWINKSDEKQNRAAEQASEYEKYTYYGVCKTVLYEVHLQTHWEAMFQYRVTPMVVEKVFVDFYVEVPV